MEETIRYDIAIIGTGPAGLEAAITATIRNKKIILFGEKDLSVKLEKAHRIDNYLGYPAISGAELGQRFRDHLDAMGIEITEDRISAVYSMGDYFSLQGNTETYEASSVILACGVVAAKPYPGETENLGRGVSYCATCDAALYRDGKEAIVIASGEREEDEAAFLAEVAAKVTYIPTYKGGESLEELRKNPRIEILEEKPESIERKDNKSILHTASGKDVIADGIFVLRESIFPDQLVPGLEINGNAVVCDREMRTNIPGCFVAGDLTGAPYQYIKSAGEGNIAAITAVGYLAELKRAATVN